MATASTAATEPLDSPPPRANGGAEGSPAVAGKTAAAAVASADAKDASQPLKTNVSRFVNAVPKLERKHSSGDLHSRLKTRKVLGVGTTDNGDVHRSKISQVLGHNEHLYVRFPRGLLGWYILVTCGLGLQGGLLLASPSWAAHLHVLAAQHAHTDGLALFSRVHGVTLLGLSHLLYAVYGTSDKVIIRSGLGALALIDVCAITAQLASFSQSETWSRWGWLQLGLHGISAGVSMAYFSLSRNYYPGVRKVTGAAQHAWLDFDPRKKSL